MYDLVKIVCSLNISLRPAGEGGRLDRAREPQGEAGQGEDEREDHLRGEGHEQQGVREAA